MDSFKSLINIGLFFVVFFVILILAYYITRFVGKRTEKTFKGKHLTVIETISIGFDKRLHLVKAGNKHLVIASFGKSMKFISEITLDLQDEEQEDTQQEANIFDFGSIFEKYLGKTNKGNLSKSSKFINSSTKSNDMNKENNLKNKYVFKSNLEKLKDMSGQDENNKS